MVSIILSLGKGFVIKESIPQDQVWVYVILNTNLWAVEQFKKFMQNKRKEKLYLMKSFC